MKGLYKTLPPFAPDYSGVCSVLFEMGGILVIHDAGGCTGNFTGYDEPRWYGNTSAVFSSELREVDAVLGDDDKLIRKIKEASKQIERKFIAVLGSPSPMVIGTDYDAIAKILEEKTQMPSFAFDTNGMDYYDIGASEAFLKIADYFVKPPQKKIKNSVNIIGACPLDLGRNKNMDDIIKRVQEQGFNILSCWCMGTNVEEISLCANAELNIVVSASGLKAARYLKNKFDIPFITGIPIGKKASLSFFSEAKNLIEGNNKKIDYGINVHDINTDRKALIIGEQIMGNSLRKMLKQDMGFEKVIVASFFKMDEELMELDDVHLKEEDSLGMLVDEDNYNMIVGDPLYKDLLRDNTKYTYIELPHIALSSRLYWDKEIEYISDNGNKIFGNT
ncbi:MAG: nitrogenase component 1 [Maledivibacter sp.]|jgi:nitrogenase molybdenum-iron protein alpha/beta subunit|nr:nitrogenase component 1 [Maledivibacter sp.]